MTTPPFTADQEARLRAIAREELARLMDVRIVAQAEARAAVDQVLSGYGIPQTAGGPEHGGA